MAEKEKSVRNTPAQEDHTRSRGISIGLSVGLSLGTLIGIAMDNIGLGMMLGAAGGLCIGSAVGVLRKKPDKKNTK